jgi:hypothetical protein
MKPEVPFRDLAVTQGLAAILLFLLIPIANAFGPNNGHRMAGVLHGLGATLTLLVATYTWHAYYSFARGNVQAERKLVWRLLITNVLVLATVIVGNWLYIGYQAPDGASEWFKLHMPFAHWVVMEYKEFVTLLTIPFGVGASFLLHRFAGNATYRKEIQGVVGILLTLMWLCLLIGFTFGLMLAKWKLV